MAQVSTPTKIGTAGLSTSMDAAIPIATTANPARMNRRVPSRPTACAWIQAAPVHVSVAAVSARPASVAVVPRQSWNATGT